MPRKVFVTSLSVIGLGRQSSVNLKSIPSSSCRRRSTFVVRGSTLLLQQAFSVRRSPAYLVSGKPPAMPTNVSVTTTQSVIPGKNAGQVYKRSMVTIRRTPTISIGVIFLQSQTFCLGFAAGLLTSFFFSYLLR